MRILAALPLLTVALWAADDDWARWRGPFENGMARGDAPTEWGDGNNVAWRTPIPGLGFSSPVIWGGRIFVTTAVPTGNTTPVQAPTGRAGGGSGAGREHKFVVMCLDRKTGKVLWERVATVATPHEGYHGRYGSFASNSPITDGKHVYAFFGSRGLYTYTLDGKLVWRKDFPPLRMHMAFGEGSAPTLDGETLYVVQDHQGDSFMLALDRNTGKEIWRVARDEPSSWSQPVVFTHNGRKQLVVSASNKVRAYDPATGKVIWECAGLGSNVIPAPVAAGGIVHVMSGHRNPFAMAIRLGGEGDLTATGAVVWTNDRGNSYTASPVLHDNKLYFITDNGMLNCFNALTGEAYYRQQRLPKVYNFKASPVGANGKLYLATEDGDVVVVKMGETFEVLATNTLADQVFISSPAIAGGNIYLRSREAIYSIGK
ncbi:MAG: hypothetical protein C0504_05125 [Candidatus Solibacter sp.]|nr:hypothetical protein [Candidatus Solibacter sp.]